MPLYSFHCKKCKKILEALIKIDDLDKEVKCPYCKKKLDKIISPVYFKIR